MSKLVLVDAISTFHVRYVVETSDDEVDQAITAVKLGKVQDEFSQKHLGETVISQRVVSVDEYLELFDKDNDYLKTWTPEQKMRYIHVHDSNDE
jgi:hypothetical protein